MSRVLKRNTGRRGYRPLQAHNFALQYREGKVRFVIGDSNLQRVERREHNGDCGTDPIIGKNHKQAIVTITERVLRLTYLCRVETKDAESVEATIVTMLKFTGLPVFSITADYGREFGNHMNIAEKLNTEFYYASPYCSWKKRASDNSNGLARQLSTKVQALQ